MPTPATTGYKEDTIRGWLAEADRHAETLEKVLLADYPVDRGQLDAPTVSCAFRNG